MEEMDPGAFDIALHGWADVTAMGAASEQDLAPVLADMTRRDVACLIYTWLLYTSDAADEGLGVEIGGRRYMKTNNIQHL